jgi:hypothetical protein
MKESIRLVLEALSIALMIPIAVLSKMSLRPDQLRPDHPYRATLRAAWYVFMAIFVVVLSVSIGLRVFG